MPRCSSRRRFAHGGVKLFGFVCRLLKLGESDFVRLRQDATC